MNNPEKRQRKNQQSVSKKNTSVTSGIRAVIRSAVITTLPQDFTISTSPLIPYIDAVLKEWHELEVSFDQKEYLSGKHWLKLLNTFDQVSQTPGLTDEEWSQVLRLKLYVAKDALSLLEGQRPVEKDNHHFPWQRETEQTKIIDTVNKSPKDHHISSHFSIEYACLAYHYIWNAFREKFTAVVSSGTQQEIFRHRSETYQELVETTSRRVQKRIKQQNEISSQEPDNVAKVMKHLARVVLLADRYYNPSRFGINESEENLDFLAKARNEVKNYMLHIADDQTRDCTYYQNLEDHHIKTFCYFSRLLDTVKAKTLGLTAGEKKLVKAKVHSHIGFLRHIEAVNNFRKQPHSPCKNLGKVFSYLRKTYGQLTLPQRKRITLYINSTVPNYIGNHIEIPTHSPIV